MAGHRRLIPTASIGLRIFLALSMALGLLEPLVAEPPKVYDIDLPAESVADALNDLSEQTGTPVVFPYDLARNRRSTPVSGRYTLSDAVSALLKDTGLTGGLSDKGVLTISASKSDSPTPKETTVTNTDNNKQTLKNRSAKPVGLAAFFASIAAAFSASAEDTSTDVSGIQQVVVTAQKKGEERIQDVPISVTALNTQDLADTNQVLLRDYYSSVPALNVTPGQQGGQAISIRGVTMGGTTSNPTVGILLDDVPLVASVSNLFSGQVPDIDPGDLARIEVLRGPQGTLYGANSMGGLLKFVTVDPTTDSFRGNLVAGTSGVHHGAQPGYELRGSANVPLTDTVAMRVSGFTRQDPGYIDNIVSHIGGVNEAEAYGGRLSVLWQPSQDFSLKLSALYQNTKANGASEADVPTTGFPATQGLGQLQQNYITGLGGYDRKVEAYSATVKARFLGMDLTSISGYLFSRYSDSLDYTAFFAPFTQNGIPGTGFNGFGVTGTPFYSHFNLDKFSQELRLSGSLTHNIDWLLGLFYTDEHSPSNQSIDAIDSTTTQFAGQWAYLGYNRSFYEGAVFADFTYHLTDRIDVQLGGRESNDRQTAAETDTGPYVSVFEGETPPYVHPYLKSNANAFTYLITPQFKISSNLMAYARFASGYRPGGPNPLAVDAPPSYGSDKTQSYEFGVKASIDDKFSIDVAGYYIDWKDIQLVLLTPKGFGYDANGNTAKSEGAELSVETRPLPGLSLNAWVSYDDAALTKALPPNTSNAFGLPGYRLPNTPRFSAHMSINDEFPLPAWPDAVGFVGAEASYVGDREGIFTAATSTRQSFPSYTRTDVRAGLKAHSWTVSLFVNNVADTRGILDGGVGYVLPYAFVYIQPRTVGLNLSRAF